MAKDSQIDFTALFTPKTGTPGDQIPQAFSVKSVDEEQRQITAIASREIIDREGEIVSLKAIKAAVKEYMKNPVLLACHQHRLADGRSPVIGSVIDCKFQGKDFIITVQFADTELGREYWTLYRDKHQRAFSIAFRVLQWHEEARDGKRIRITDEIELYEISCCAVPCNPAALSKGKAFLSQKRLEREKQRILADDAAYIELLERFSALEDEHGDIFKNLPGDHAAWQQFSAAEIELLRELNTSGEEYSEYMLNGAGSDQEPPCGGWDLEDGNTAEDYAKELVDDPAAFESDSEGSGDQEPDYAKFLRH